MQEMYEMIMKHKRAMADMQMIWEKAIRDHQHEYDSDEEVDERAGTWEHRLRKMEMEKTRGKTGPSSPYSALSFENPYLVLVKTVVAILKKKMTVLLQSGQNH